MPKGMVITVGMGRGIEHAIVLSIRDANPDHIVFLVTEQSKDTLKRIEQTAQQLGVTLPHYECVLVQNENDAERTYKAAVAAIRKLGEQGITPANIKVDYTTGSKPMSAGALYAAIMEGCADVVYVTGQRDENGRVISGTEQFLTVTLNLLIARRVQMEAVRLFNAYQFAAANQVIETFLSPSLTDRVKQLFPDLDGLRLLCCAYHAWDAFDHDKAKKDFDNIDRTMMERWSPKIAENKGWVNRIARSLSSDELSQRLCKELLVDLWTNALRRLQEGRFIDAIARLYRLAELIAQFRLWHGYKIDTGNLDMSKVPENLREDLERYRKDGKVKIPLEAAYRLLQALGDNLLGDAYEKPSLRDALGRRNDSIAAHGLSPVTNETAQRLREEVEHLLRQLVPELDSLLEKATFPRLS